MPDFYPHTASADQIEAEFDRYFGDLHLKGSGMEYDLNEATNATGPALKKFDADLFEGAYQKKLKQNIKWRAALFETAQELITTGDYEVAKNIREMKPKPTDTTFKNLENRFTRFRRLREQFVEISPFEKFHDDKLAHALMNGRMRAAAELFYKANKKQKKKWIERLDRARAQHDVSNNLDDF